MLFDFKRLIICILFFSVFALKIIIERVFLFGRHVFVSLSIIRYDNNKNKKQLILHQKFETNITTHNIVIYFFFFLVYSAASYNLHTCMYSRNNLYSLGVLLK